MKNSEKVAETGKRIKFARKSMGLTQAKMSALLGISQPNYSYYESGACIPSLEVILKLSHASGISIDYLSGCSDQIYQIDLIGAVNDGKAELTSKGDDEFVLKIKDAELLEKLRAAQEESQK